MNREEIFKSTLEQMRTAINTRDFQTLTKLNLPTKLTYLHKVF